MLHFACNRAACHPFCINCIGSNAFVTLKTAGPSTQRGNEADCLIVQPGGINSPLTDVSFSFGKWVCTCIFCAFYGFCGVFVYNIAWRDLKQWDHWSDWTSACPIGHCVLSDTLVWIGYCAWLRLQAVLSPLSVFSGFYSPKTGVKISCNSPPLSFRLKSPLSCSLLRV